MNVLGALGSQIEAIELKYKIIMQKYGYQAKNLGIKELFRNNRKIEEEIKWK